MITGYDTTPLNKKNVVIVICIQTQWRRQGGGEGPAPGVTILGWHHFMIPIQQKNNMFNNIRNV